MSELRGEILCNSREVTSIIWMRFIYQSFHVLASVQRRASYELEEHHMNEIQISEFPPFGFSSTKEGIATCAWNIHTRTKIQCENWYTLFIGWKLFQNWTIAMNDNSEQIKLAQEYFANITRKYQHLDSISSSEDEGKTEVPFSEI